MQIVTDARQMTVTSAPLNSTATTTTREMLLPVDNCVMIRWGQAPVIHCDGMEEHVSFLPSAAAVLSDRVEPITDTDSVLCNVMHS